MKDLIAKLNKYRDSYYNNNVSLVSDYEYDQLFDKLVEMEKKQGIVYPNSPTQTVGYTVIDSLTKVKHNHPLLSLDKTTDIEAFKDYFANKEMTLMAKMDGLTCSLTYDKGELVLAESRGNGEIGEDITHNARVIANLPKKINYMGKLIIDGECIIDDESFKKINDPLIHKAESEAREKELTGIDFSEYIRKHTYANPRNLVSGTVRQLNSEVAAKRNVKFIAWKLHSAMLDEETENYVSNYYVTSFLFLSGLGFEVVPHKTISKLKNELNKTINDIKDLCEKKGYPIDGMVGSFNDVKYGESLGSTSHHPKHSLAFKFYQERNKTILRNIEWSVSRTGLVNPVAVLDPVEIDGTMVSRASLSNVSIIKELELGIGDEVSLIKANQIIPQITENLTRSNTYVIPDTCPSCGSKLIIKADSGRETLYCENEDCHQKIVDKLTNFAGKNGMDIVGLSYETISKLVQTGYLKKFTDIYELWKYKNVLMCIDGFGKSKTQNLIDSIEKSTNQKFSSFLVAIGIPGIGKSAAKSMASYCESMLAPDDDLLLGLLSLCESNLDWSKLPGFGASTSDGINSYISMNHDEIVSLSYYLKPNRTTMNATSSALAGKTFCITGKLVHFSNREALVNDIEMRGGKIVSGVSAKTDYLITNDKGSGSSKNQKAQKLGIKIISEEEYLAL